jgi:hypothetical protein
MRRSWPTPQNVREFERIAVGQGLQGPEGRHFAPLAQQRGRQIDQQFVDQAGAQQRGVELVAGFDVQFVHAALRQVTEHRDQVDLVMAIGHQA